MGLDGVGLEPDRLAVLGDRLVVLAFHLAVKQPRLFVGPGEVGLSRIASRYSAIASSRLALARRARPRLKWVPGRRA